MIFKVIGTFREKECNRSTSIAGLRVSFLDKYYDDSLEQLKDEADKERLYVEVGRECKKVKVRIFWSEWHKRFIATTNADYTTCNNLLSLPVYRRSWVFGQGETTLACAI